MAMKNSIKILGVILDENIYLEGSHTSIRKQNTKNYRFIFKKTEHLNVTSPESICFSYVLLYMNYANITNLQSLHGKQKHTILIILNEN